MSGIPADTLNKLGSAQNQIWQTVSLTVSEAANQSLAFGSPLTVSTKTADLYSELTAPMMVIQFAFANQPENSQVILIPQETVLGLVLLVQGTEIDEVDENTVADLRNPLEAVIQGICLAIGNLKNEPIVASGLSIRFQIFSFPPNLQRSSDLVRVQVAITGEEQSGTLTWLCDSATAHYILGLTEVEQSESDFPEISADGTTSQAPRPIHAHEDPNGLELLLDIPLEISVELGRVRMMVKEVIELGTGSIVEIDKAAGEPVDVMVNGRLVARGEVVVIEDNFGVRITEILSPAERMGRFGDAA